MLSKQFVKAKIEEKNGLFITTLTYSWYGVYHYDIVNVFTSLEESERHMLYERCGGLVEYSLKENENSKNEEKNEKVPMIDHDTKK